MSVFEALPPAAIPVVAAIIAAVIGTLLWRLFKLAMKVVAFVVFLIVLAGVVLWWQPQLIGIGKGVVEERLGPLPSVDDATRNFQGRVEDAAAEKAADVVRDALPDRSKATIPTADTPADKKKTP